MKTDIEMLLRHPDAFELTQLPCGLRHLFDPAEDDEVVIESPRHQRVVPIKQTLSTYPLV